MYTIQEIKTAHSKVKTGADFPKYVQELKTLGLSHYENFVSDGHTDYYGHNGEMLSADAKYELLTIAPSSSVEKLKHSLTVHQQGQTDYLTFCRQAADAGVLKWTVRINELLCTYYDLKGQIMIEEQIPS